MSDAHEAYNWMVENSDKLNIEKDKIIVGEGLPEVILLHHLQ